MLILDRFENNMAVIEIKEGTIEVPRQYLPDDAKEGDILQIIVNKSETEKRKQHIKKLSDELFE